MLPPVDEQLLRDNPGFSSLYATLTSVILNPDGSTQRDAAADEHATVREELGRLRVAAAKQHILERAMAAAAPPEPNRPPVPGSLGQPRRREPGPAAAELPEPLLDLLALLPPLIEAERAGPLPPEAAALLELAAVEPLLPRVAAVVSASLHSSALGLARVVHPTTNPSYLHRHVGSLPDDCSTLMARVAAARQSLAAARLRTVASLTGLVDCYTRSLSCLVRSLEAKHGVVARGLELRASDVSLQAQRSDLDASDAMRTLTRHLYSPQAVAALRNYAQHLSTAQARAAERVGGLQAHLADYGVGSLGTEAKEKTMRDMARLHRDMARQMDDVKSHLSRLHDG